jgi:hypothetical protein
MIEKLILADPLSAVKETEKRHSPRCLISYLKNWNIKILHALPLALFGIFPAETVHSQEKGYIQISHATSLGLKKKIFYLQDYFPKFAGK